MDILGWIYRPDVTCMVVLVIIPCNDRVNSHLMHIMEDIRRTWGQTNTLPVGSIERPEIGNVMCVTIILLEP